MEILCLGDRKRVSNHITHTNMNTPTINLPMQKRLLEATPPEIRSAIVDAIKEANNVAVLIESQPPTTKDYYGSYLPLIRNKNDVLMFLIAGANKAGILAASKLHGVSFI